MDSKCVSLLLVAINPWLKLFDCRVGKRLLRRLPSGPIVFKLLLKSKETSLEPPH